MKDENIEPVKLLEGLRTTPARRYLSDKPISDEIVWNILDTAIRGPSGGNSQGWGWIVVKDQDVMDQVASWYRQGWDRAYGVKREQILKGIDNSDMLGSRNYLSAEHLANHIQEAPVWIIAVLRNTAMSDSPRSGSSIYGAIQNLMLAARAYGIGTTLTTLYIAHENEVKKLLQIPEDAMTMALVPLGYPIQGKWAMPKRQSVEDVTHWGMWGNQRQR